MTLNLYAIDIDGTIANAVHRHALAGPEPKGKKTSKEYKKWIKTIMDHELMAQDKPVPGMLEMIEALHQEGHIVVYITSREECHRDVTERWLDDHGFLESARALLMRPQSNLAADFELKEAEIDALVAEYRPDAVVVIDDDLRGTLVEVCKKNGWTFLKAFASI